MANIHRLGDYNNNDNNNNDQNRRNVSILGGNNNNSNPINPRGESFGSFLKNICPNFKFISFIFIITIIDVLMHVIALAYGGIDVISNGLLAPTKEALDFLGESVNNTTLKLGL